MKDFISFDSTEAKTIRYRVHTILLADVDDPDLYVAEPIYKWQQTEAGKYVMEHSCPKANWHRHINVATYWYEYFITAYFTPEQLTYWKLKFE